jgi:hypothetical protein
MYICMYVCMYVRTYMYVYKHRQRGALYNTSHQTKICNREVQFPRLKSPMSKSNTKTMLTSYCHIKEINYKTHSFRAANKNCIFKFWILKLHITIKFGNFVTVFTSWQYAFLHTNSGNLSTENTTATATILSWIWGFYHDKLYFPEFEGSIMTS